MSDEFSAGGVVVRDGEVAVIVPIKRAADGTRVLGLPKGHLDGEETAEQAALREVREESGLECELIEKLGEVSYQYEWKARNISKVVAFFVMEYRAGDVADHDHEIEDAYWLPLERAAVELTYAGEREMVRRAMSQTSPDR